MKNLMKLATVAASFTFLVGCGGGGGPKTPVSEKTQAEKANLLVRGLNTYTVTESSYKEVTEYGYHYNSFGQYVLGYYTDYKYVTETVEKQSTQYGVAKLDSLVKGTAVLVDTYTNRFFAISLSAYYTITADTFSYTNTGANAYKESQTSAGLAFYNLVPNGDTTYSYIVNGQVVMKFNVTEISPSQIDMLALEGMKQDALVAHYKNQFEGLKLSSAKSEQAAELLAAAQNNNGGVSNLTKAQFSGITTAVIGSNVDQISAAVSGDVSAQASVLANAITSGAIENSADGFALANALAKSLGE